MTQFIGHRRPDGRVGVRNIVAVVSAMDNTNPCASRIADIVDGTIAIGTPFGRTQIGHDFEMTLRSLAGIGAHPNGASVLVLGLSMATATAQRTASNPAANQSKHLACRKPAAPWP